MPTYSKNLVQQGHRQHAHLGFMATCPLFYALQMPLQAVVETFTQSCVAGGFSNGSQAQPKQRETGNLATD